MRSLLITGTLLVMISAAGCIQAGESSLKTSTMTDDTGAVVEVPVKVERIVSLAPSETEVVCVLGQGDRLVGRTDYCNFPAEVRDIPSVGGPKTLSIEAIVGLRPDLVLATTITDTTIVEGLRAVGVPVLVFRLESLDDVYANIACVGDILGCSDTAELVVSGMRLREESVRANTCHASPVRVMYVLWDDPLIVAGNNTLQNDLITAAGGINIAADAEGYVIISDETVVSGQPDVIIVSETHAAGTVPIKERLLEKPTLSDIPAVKTGRIYTIDGDLANRPGPRMIETLEMFASCMHA